MRFKTFILDLLFFAALFLILVFGKLIIAQFLVYSQSMNFDFNLDNMTYEELNSAAGSVNNFDYLLSGTYLFMMYIIPFLLFSLFILVQLLQISSKKVRLHYIKKGFLLSLAILVLFYLLENFILLSFAMMLYDFTYFIYLILILLLFFILLYLWYSLVLLSFDNWKKLFRKFYFSFVPFAILGVIILLLDIYLVFRFLTSSFNGYEWVYEIVLGLILIYFLGMLRNYYIRRVYN